MPEFAYTARSVQGQDSSGVISAGSRREAIALLAEKSLFPLRVEAQAAAGERKLRLPWRRRVKSEVLADTFTQLSDLLSNGVPLLESLDILSQQTVDERLAEVLLDVRRQVADGTGLDTAHGRVIRECFRRWRSAWCGPDWKVRSWKRLWSASHRFCASRRRCG